MVSESPVSVLALLTGPKKIGLTGSTFLAYVLPPFASQYLMGGLVQLEGTRIYRLAFLPVLVWFAWRATFVDMSGGDVTKIQANSSFATLMCLTAMRSAVWAFSLSRYRRLREGPEVARRDAEADNDGSIYTVCWNTLDLVTNARGIGWDWPHGLVVPKHTFDVDSSIPIFLLSSAASVAFHALSFDVCVQVIRHLSPDTFGSPKGGSLFDGALSPTLECARALLVSVLGGASAYFGLQYTYHLLAIIAVVLFRQRPSHWPPAFDAPWRATSLSELWGRRFHQFLREIVLTLGKQPMAWLFGGAESTVGRAAGLLSAFLVSGVIHDIELRSAGRDCSAFVVVGFWVMNGVGVVLERVWKDVTGKPVGGFLGRVWMVGWVVLLGVPTVNEYAKVGRFAALSLPGGLEPSLALAGFICAAVFFNTLMDTPDIFSMSQKISPTGPILLLRILPPVVCQVVMGVLVQLEGTRFYRLALLPVVLWLAYRAVFVDLSGGDPKQSQMNAVLVTHMCGIAMRATVWATAQQPFRLTGPSEKEEGKSVYTAMWNSWNLLFNTRGIGWNWPRGLVVPKPAFETDSRFLFVLWSAVQLAFHAFCFDACLQIMRVLSPDTLGSLNGGSLFDHTLPPLLELLRSLLFSFLAAFVAYSAIQWGYQLLAIVSVTVFRHRPSFWPPLFDSPWLSTSLTELWGRRWHQMMREPVVMLGMQPFGYLFGRWAGLIAAFLISGIFHDIELRSLGRGGHSVKVIGFWAMNSVGVVLEQVWRRTTGRHVGGMCGWIWTFGWLALWGVPLVDEWAKAGRFGTLSLPGEIEPARALVRGLLL